MSIGIVNYGVGNIASLTNLIANELGLSVHIIRSRADVARSTVIILPGVGAFDTAIASMQKSGLISAVKEAAADPDKTIIGICLGMQLLFERSEEGESEGLALLEGQVKRIPDQSVVLPHVGWNPLVSKCADDLLAIDSKEVYFTHSYYVECDDKYIEYYVDYEVEVPAVIRHGNLIGFQFHPEKSSSVGRELLKSVIVA